MEEERPHMERDGAVRGIWSGTGPELCPSGPAGRASRHFTAPRGLGWLLFFFFSLSPFLRQSRRGFAAAVPPCPSSPLPSNHTAGRPRLRRCHWREEGVVPPSGGACSVQGGRSGISHGKRRFSQTFRV